MEDVELLPLADGDLPAVLDLLRLCLGEGTVPRSADFWHWKHDANPFGRSPALIAKVSGRVVALRTFLRWRWQHGGQEIPAARAVDTVTHPDFRGRGLFSRLTQRLLAQEQARGTAFIFNTPNRISGRGYLRLGWSTVGRVPLLVRPRLSLAPLRGWPRGAASPGPSLRQLASVDDLLGMSGFAELLEEAQAGGPPGQCQTALTAEFLRWRYAEVPHLRYRAAWHGGNPPSAAVILRGRKRWRLREAIITEVLALPTAAGLREATELLRDVCRRVDADYLVAVASGGSPERTALHRAGFLPLPATGPILVVRPLHSDLPGPGPRLADWRLSAGCVELF